MNKKLLILLLLIFLAKILITIYQNLDYTIESGDCLAYNGFAIRILEDSNWLTEIKGLNGEYREPLYSIILAFIYFIFGKNNFIAVFILQHISILVLSILIYSFCKKVWNSKVGFIAALWSSLYPQYYLYSNQIARESLIFLLLFLCFYLLYSYLRSEYSGYISLFLFAFCITILIHLDARYLFYLPFFIFLFFLYLRKKNAIKNYMVFAVFVSILFVPWTIRNYLAFDTFVFVSGRTFMLESNNKNINPNVYLDISSGDEKFINEIYPLDEERELIKEGKNPNNRKPEIVKAIREGKVATKDPFLKRLYFLNSLWRPIHLTSDFRPYPDCRFDKKWSLAHNLASGLTFGLLLPFMLFATYKLWYKNRELMFFLILPIFLQTLLHLITWGLERYRLPIDSFVIILGCYGIMETYNFLKTKYFTRKVELAS